MLQRLWAALEGWVKIVLMSLAIHQATLSSYPYLKTEVQISQPSKFALKRDPCISASWLHRATSPSILRSPNPAPGFLILISISPGGRGWSLPSICNTSLLTYSTTCSTNTNHQNVNQTPNQKAHPRQTRCPCACSQETRPSTRTKHNSQTRRRESTRRQSTRSSSASSSKQSTRSAKSTSRQSRSNKSARPPSSSQARTR
jgi:hypothetical protein